MDSETIIRNKINNYQYVIDIILFFLAIEINLNQDPEI